MATYCLGRADERSDPILGLGICVVSHPRPPHISVNALFTLQFISTSFLANSLLSIHSKFENGQGDIYWVRMNGRVFQILVCFVTCLTGRNGKNFWATWLEFGVDNEAGIGLLGLLKATGVWLPLFYIWRHLLQKTKFMPILGKIIERIPALRLGYQYRWQLLQYDYSRFNIETSNSRISHHIQYDYCI